MGETVVEGVRSIHRTRFLVHWFFDVLSKCTELRLFSHWYLTCFGNAPNGVGGWGGCSTDWGTGLVSNRIVRHSRSRPLSDVRPRPNTIVWMFDRK